MLPQSPRLKDRFKKVTEVHRFKNATAVIASWMSPLSPLQLQECYTGHCYRSVTAVTASRILPQSSLQEGYGSHCFKQVTVVTASRMLHRPLLQECYGSHRFKNFTAVIASRRLQQSLLQAGCRSLRFKNVTTVTAAVIAPRTLLLLPFLHLFTPSVLAGVHSHTLFGVSCREK